MAAKPRSVGFVAACAASEATIALNAPVELQIFENKRLLGTSQSDRIMIGAGRHELEVVNETIGYRTTASVIVAPGKVAPIKLDWPKGAASINAQP